MYLPWMSERTHTTAFIFSNVNSSCQCLKMHFCEMSLPIMLAAGL
uniref:Uncharacterized protein n=1 Tax=Anguilla anguilla TaxID=7936 RepID=A0A0E9THX0_ANGAN